MSEKQGRQTHVQRGSDDAGEVEAILREGRDNPLSPAERRQLLERILRRVREGASRRGDTATIQAVGRVAGRLCGLGQSARRSSAEPGPRAPPAPASRAHGAPSGSGCRRCRRWR